MQYYNGTLAGAFYVGNKVRQVMRDWEQEEEGFIKSADKAIGKDGKNTILDLMSNKHKNRENATAFGNDILMYYDYASGFDRDKMLVEIGKRYYLKLMEEAGLDASASDKKKMELAKQVLEYNKKLDQLESDVIQEMYLQAIQGDFTDTKIELDPAEAKKIVASRRVNTVDRIKRASKSLMKLVDDGKISFKELPQEIQDMYEMQDVVLKDGRKTKVRALKSSVYSVGRGRKKIEVEDSSGRFKYSPKHDINKGNDEFKHDTKDLARNEELLKNTLKAAKAVVKTRAELLGETGTVKREKRNRDKGAQALADALRVKNVPVDKQKKTTEFRVNKPRVNKKTHEKSDTPNVFHITSGVDMPEVLKDILDVSFVDFADTKVQFASRDAETGELYSKEAFSEKDFNSRVQHEVNSWDAFYEVNALALSKLTRKDVLDIVEFYQRGAQTVDGPMNKFVSFKIFMLGFIVNGARSNFNNWDFSQAEIYMLVSLYESVASSFGSGLNAVGQMLKLIDPMKKIRQLMFNDWETINDDDKEHLIAAVYKMQKEKDLETQQELAKDVMAMLDEFLKRQRTADAKLQSKRWSKEWWKRLWSKGKSWRYMSMLSGFPTWIRNQVSNVLLSTLNAASDAVSGMIFTNKGYVKDQWDLHKTTISPEAKTFIDTYILDNKVFEALYDTQGKYDTRNKKTFGEKRMLVNLIVKAYERKYAQGQRFDSDAMNRVAKFIDNRMSDRRFVKFAAGRYFGKILTIEASRGRVKLSEGLSDKALDLFAEAVIMANQEYMHKRSAVSDMLDGIRLTHPLLYETLTFWQPFWNSSLNWFMEAFKYTPIGLANSIIRACRLEKQIEKMDKQRARGEINIDSRAAQFLARRDIGKGLIGLLLSIFGALLAGFNLIRIDEEDDKFYLYVGENTKVDISDMFASSSVLIGAAVAQKWIEQKDGKSMSTEDVLSNLTDILVDGFFATDLLERHKWGGTLEDIFTETDGVLRSFVPQAWQIIVAMTSNNKIRYSSGFKGAFERWVNTLVPTQPMGNRVVNPYTGEIEDKYAITFLGIGALLQKGLILGSKVYTFEVSEEERLCREYGVNKAELTGELEIDDVVHKLDRIPLNQKYGALNKKSLSKIKSQKHSVEMPDGKYKTLSWDQMNDKQRTVVLSRTMTHNAQLAKIYSWTQNGGKYYASDSLYKELRSLGITQNVYKGDKGFVK
jgi:hypothetical protein